MAPAKTLYVKEADEPLWRRFEKAVNEWQVADSVSALVAESMRLYLDQFGDQGDGLYIRPPDFDPGDGPPAGASAFLQLNDEGWTLFVPVDAEGNPCGADAMHAWDTHLLCRRDFSVVEAAAQARAHLTARRHVAAFKPIEVECEDRNGNVRTERFTGRWLVEPDSDETRASASDYDDGTNWDAGFYFGIALTRRGQLAVYSAHCNRDGGDLTVYTTPDELRDSGVVPPSIVSEALAEMSDKPLVIERDI